MTKRDYDLRVWITKYALTTGIFVVDAHSSTERPGMVHYISNAGYRSFAHGRDWHLSEAGAKARAEEMRLNRIASLEAQLAKLRALTF